MNQSVPERYEMTVTVNNELGLHARPAALVAQTAQSYPADIFLSTPEKRAEAKSILDILSLAAGKGTCLTIQGEGMGAENCVKEIAKLIVRQFQEGAE